METKTKFFAFFAVLAVVAIVVGVIVFFPGKQGTSSKDISSGNVTQIIQEASARYDEKLANNDIDGAIEEYNFIKENLPEDSIDFDYIAVPFLRFLHEKGKLKSYGKQVESELTNTEKDLLSLKELIFIYEDYLNDEEKAQQYKEEYLKYRPNPSDQLRLAQDKIRKENYDNALEIAEQAAAHPDVNGLEIMYVAEDFLKNNRTEESRILSNIVLKDPKSGANSLSYAGSLYQKFLGDNMSALVAYEKAYELVKNDENDQSRAAKYLVHIYEIKINDGIIIPEMRENLLKIAQNEYNEPPTIDRAKKLLFKLEKS